MKKRRKLAGKYDGPLARRSNDLHPTTWALEGAVVLLGTPELLAARERAISEWKARYMERMAAGMSLLFEHYGIDDRNNFASLALRLAHDHVPMCMPPAPSRGRPRRLEDFLPLVDALSRAKLNPGATWQDVLDAFAEGLEVDADTVARKLRNYRAAKKKR